MSRPPISPLSLTARREVVYDCPWCPVHVTDDEPYVSPAMRDYQGHLDQHVAAGDHLRPGASLIAPTGPSLGTVAA